MLTPSCTLELQMINDVFSTYEILYAIRSLKNNKAPGIDGIPVEIIKYCQMESIDLITDIFNYIVENRDFPDIWSEGLRSAIFKSGSKHYVDNYRGITSWCIFAKLFETAVNNRLRLANEAFERKDVFNGGFQNGGRTTDNIFILNGLVQRQLSLGKSLYLCYVDFRKAFDLVNRNLLFYKITKSGWRGNVIDTLRNLYTKTCFRVKCNGKVSPPIIDSLGVTQGGITSGLLFRKYMSDLSDYLRNEFAMYVSMT